MPTIAQVILRDVTAEQYDAVRAAAGWLDQPPEGGIAHVTWWQGPDCFSLDVWQSEDHFDAFGQDRLGPAMAAAGVTTAPEVTFVESHEVFLPRALTIAPTAGRERPNADIVRTGYEAFARQDIPAVLAIFDPELVWSTPATVRFGGTYRGPAGAGEFFSRLPENFAELAVTPERFVEQGDTVVALGRHIGKSHSGNSFEIPFVHVWTLRDGKATSFTETFDTVQLNAALGLVPEQSGAVDVGAMANAGSG